MKWLKCVVLSASFALPATAQSPNATCALFTHTLPQQTPAHEMTHCLAFQATRPRAVTPAVDEGFAVMAPRPRRSLLPSAQSAVKASCAPSPSATSSGRHF